MNNKLKITSAVLSASLVDNYDNVDKDKNKIVKFWHEAIDLYLWRNQ